MLPSSTRIEPWGNDAREEKNRKHFISKNRLKKLLFAAMEVRTLTLTGMMSS